MQPPIRYSPTHDGYDIAHWGVGEGPALVVMPSLPWSHIQLEWGIPAVRDWYEAVGRGRQLIRYDGRGFGLSSRDVSEVSLETDIADLAAVVDGLSLERFDLYAGLHSGPAAIAYSVRNPERVGHLVLFCTYPDGSAHRSNPLMQATRPIITQDWEFYTQAVSRLLLGWSEPEAAQSFSDLVRQCTSQEFAALALEATTEFDVTGLLSDVAAPTLVLHRPEQRTSSMDSARRLAAGIPDVRLSLHSGETIAPFLGDDTDAVVREIDAFLTGRVATDSTSSGDERPALRQDGWGSGVSTVVFTDIVASTELVERMGDEAARNAFRSLEEASASTAARHTGRVVKHLGDGSLLEFASTAGALRFAVDIQEASRDLTLQLRVGMAVGEPIREDGDLHGTVVVLAGRIADSAEAGEVFASDALRQLVHGKGFEFADAGMHELKGLHEPVQLWRLRSDSERPRSRHSSELDADEGGIKPDLR